MEVGSTGSREFENMMEETVIKYVREIVSLASGSDKFLENLCEIHLRLCWISGYLSVIFPDANTDFPAHAFIESELLQIAWVTCASQDGQPASFGSRNHSFDRNSTDLMSQLSRVIFDLQKDLSDLIAVLIRKAESNPSSFVEMRLPEILGKINRDRSTINRWANNKEILAVRKVEGDKSGRYLVDITSQFWIAVLNE